MINPADCLYKFKNMNLLSVISAARIHFCSEVLVLVTFVQKHYKVISIVATNVFGALRYKELLK